MEPDVTVIISTSNIQLKLTDPNSDQQAAVAAADQVTLNVSDSLTVNQLNVQGGGGGISGVIVEDESIEVGTYTKLNFKGAQVVASEEDADTAQIVITGDGAGGSLFLPTATYYDDTDETYFYFGWTAAQTGGEWLVRRSNRTTLANEDADQTSNPAYADLDAAWPNRASLTYA